MSPLRRHMRAFALSIAIAASAAGASPVNAAVRQDLRSPDARDAAVVRSVGQDLRSPDARDAAAVGSVGQDLRSPDARDAANPSPAITSAQTGPALAESPDSVLPLALGGSAAILAMLGFSGILLVSRRRHVAARTVVQ